MTWRKELETLLVQLRLAAVDAYMRNRGTMKEEWRVRGEFYVEDRSTLPIVGESKLCRRPNEQGYGGGELYERASERLIGSDRYVVKFRDIQSQIDRIVDPWYHLPDPALIGEAVVAYRNVLEDLSVGVNEYITGDERSIDSFDFHAWTPSGRAEAQGRGRLMSALDALGSRDSETSRTDARDGQCLAQEEVGSGADKVFPEGASGSIGPSVTHGFVDPFSRDGGKR